jgi:hypothetical protein
VVTSTVLLLGADLKNTGQRHRVALEAAGYNVVMDESPDKSPSGPTVALVSGPDGAHEFRKWRQHSPRVQPALVGESTLVITGGDLALESAPVLSSDVSLGDLLRVVAFLFRGDGWLLRELSELDRNAKQLVDDEICEWVRSRPGIIGMVRLARLQASVDHVAATFRRLVDHAYALLDKLPQEQLSVEDIWNVTLLIAVPVKEADVDRDSDVGKFLHGISQDVTGSRKLVLWVDQSVGDYFGPLGAGRHIWKLSSDDPLRQALESFAVDSLEREALEVIFKRRLSQEDIDELLRVLSRQL